MSVLYIQGGRPLEGQLRVHGAKNSVLPILAACLMARGQVELHNCPSLTDVHAALDILRHLGCRTWQEGDTVSIDSSCCTGSSIPDEKMRAMRSSILFLGPLLARQGEARLTCPGGCELGPRPIDLHLSALRSMGIQVEEGPEIICRGRPQGGEVHLALPSVGATENAMLCAAGAAETTVIRNAAGEPEIEDLQNFLNALGAHVSGAGTSAITVEGGYPLHGGAFTVMGDRIVAATLLSAAAAAGGRVRLSGVRPEHLTSVLEVLRHAGCTVRARPQQTIHAPAQADSNPERILELERRPDKPLQGVPVVRTASYPGFPTDAQAPVMAALAAAQGCTLFVENIFESRFRHVPELCRMGADILTEGRAALVRGVPRLHGAAVEARDLRGGGALAAAALGAEGATVLSGLHHIDRGYESLENMLRTLGAAAERREQSA